MIKRGSAISHTVIPALLQFKVDEKRKFIFESEMAVAYTDNRVASIAERFCSDVVRRTEVRFKPITGQPGPNEPSIKVQLAGDHEIRALPRPAGVWPVGDGPADERHSITIAIDGVVVRAVEPVGVARALMTLIQFLATAPRVDARKISVQCGRILDAPRYAWRGLSLDLSRTFFTVGEIQRIIDLLTLYKLNVLHLHLTDDQSWRLPMGRSGTGPESTGNFYSDDDLRRLVHYAEDRFVTVVPEVDMPGHASALIKLNPALDTGRNNMEFEIKIGREHRNAWLDPELPATFELIEEILVDVAGIFSGSYIHIGGDEPCGMPRDLYSTYVQRARCFIRSIGKQPLGWQESARAGLGPGDVIQYWSTAIALAESLPPEARPETPEQQVVDLAMRDIEAAAEVSVPMIMSPQSHCYLDVPYAERSTEAAEADRQGRVGLRRYSPKTVAESFNWEPSQAVGPSHAAQVAGVEAAIWAETISDFDDLSFLLLPRLPGIAEKAWSAPAAADWSQYRDRLARHGRLWTQDDLTYFHASTVDWP